MHPYGWPPKLGSRQLASCVNVIRIYMRKPVFAFDNWHIGSVNDRDIALRQWDSGNIPVDYDLTFLHQLSSQGR